MRFFTRTAKPMTSDEQFEQRLVRLGNYITQQSSMSDNTYKLLLADLIDVVVVYEKVNELKQAIDSLLKDVFFVTAHQKISVHILICLALSEIRLSNRDERFLLKAQGIKELELAHLFYSHIGHTSGGYEWANTEKGLISEAWIYVKNGNGRFAKHLSFIHSIGVSIPDGQTGEANDNEGNDYEIDENFTSNDEEEIGAIFGLPEGDDSDEGLLKLISDSPNETEATDNLNESVIDENDTELEDPMKLF